MYPVKIRLRVSGSRGLVRFAEPGASGLFSRSEPAVLAGSRRRAGSGLFERSLRKRNLPAARRAGELRRTCRVDDSSTHLLEFGL